VKKPAEGASSTGRFACFFFEREKGFETLDVQLKSDGLLRQ